MRLSQSLLPLVRIFAVIEMILLLVLGALSSPSGSKFKVLHRFYAGKNDNGGLWGGLAIDSKGNLYGTTWGGGSQGFGTVFELMPSGGQWTIKILHSFDPYIEGDATLGTLLLDGSEIFGTTSAGGSNGAGGTTFEMTRKSGRWISRVISNYGSHAGVVMDAAGNLYGNIGPGKYDEGAVTELARGPTGWTQNYLYSFCAQTGCPDGSLPSSGVIFDSAGNLYGTTEYGGSGVYSGDFGTVYELRHKSNGTWEHVILHSFQAFRKDGVRPLAGLVLDKAGNLYGTTSGGGDIDCGTVFKLTPGAKGWKETWVHVFLDPATGCGPSGVTFDESGNLYGTAGGGTGDCAGGCGVVFKLTPGADEKWKYSVLHQFIDSDGAIPDSGVIVDKKGNLYGSTVLGGGGHSVGVVFEITP